MIEQHDDIRDHATELLRKFGDGAFLIAANKADAALNKHDFDSHHLWCAVVRKIGEIEASTPDVSSTHL